MSHVYWHRGCAEPAQRLEFDIGKHELQFKIHIAAYPPEGAAREDRGKPFELATDAVEFELVRVDEKDDATETVLENIRRELIAFPRFHTPVVSRTLSRLIRENLPRSGAYLIDVLGSNEQSLHWPASVAFAKHWEIIPHKHIEQYLQASLTTRVALREVYPEGVDAAIELGYGFQPGYLGMPADKNYRLDTKTTHYLDDRQYGEPYSYSGIGATTGWIHAKELTEGPHHIRLVTEYRFTRDDFACTGRVESARYDFQIGPPEMADDLLAPHDLEVDALVRESLKFAETDDGFEPRDSLMQRDSSPHFSRHDPWRAQMTRVHKDGPTISLETAQDDEADAVLEVPFRRGGVRHLMQLANCHSALR